MTNPYKTKKNLTFLKKANNWNRYFSKEDMQMTNKHVK